MAEMYFTNSYASYKVGPLFKRPPEQIPDPVVGAVREALLRAVKVGALRSFVVHGFGGTDLDLHVTHNSGERNASVHRLMFEALVEGLKKAEAKGLLKIRLDSLSEEELLRELHPLVNDDSKIERAAEPVVIAKGIKVAIGAVNIKLFREFALLGSTPLQKLGLKKSPGWRFRVKRTQDILAGNSDGPEWEFEISHDRKTKDGQTLAGRNEGVQLLALASQPNDYQITAVYPVEGGAFSADEPAATVIYQPLFPPGEGVALNPTVIYRSQSGGDAVGGIANMIFGVNFVPGGEKGQYFVATYPVTLEEAKKRFPVKEKGLGFFTAYAYQSRKGGEIPYEGYEDLVAQNPASYGPERRLARELGWVMSSHGESQPHLAPFAASRGVEALRHEQDSLFHAAPRESEVDPVLEPLEERIKKEKWVVVGDDKADMGGVLGHTRVPEYMIAVYKATLREAIEAGVEVTGQTVRLTDGNTFGLVDHKRVGDRENRGVGDDGHLVMLGDNSIYGRASHQLSFIAFTRAYHYAQVLSKQPYGLGQDYQGAEAKNAKANPELYARYTERYFELLQKYLPESEMEQGAVESLHKHWEQWKATGVSARLTEPFSGNVTQQGIGSARYPFDPRREKTFDLLAGDKMGPPAFNLLIQESVFAALGSGAFPKGLVFEIWDLKAFPRGVTPETATPEQLREIPTRRIFLDARKNREWVKRYLADSDRFNVRNVWSKKKSGWDLRRPEAYLDRILLSSSVTRLGLLAGGEYVGKDDPLILGNSKLMNYLYRFLLKRPLIVQGDMNGSHWEWAVPCSLKYAVATIRSHPIFAAARYTVSAEGKRFVRVQDIFGERAYEKVREKAYGFNAEFDRSQLSQFEPHGTNVRTVEASYELANILRELNRPDSPFLVRNKKKANPDRLWPEPASNQLDSLYRAVLAQPEVPRSEVKATRT
jgi:fructose 1,6-bisphosphatase